MSGELLANGKVTLYCGDCLEVMASLPENLVDSIVSDPPYHLTSIVKRFGAPDATLNKDYGKSGVYKRSAAGFMGKQWDGGDIAFRPETWALAYRVLKPGGHIVAFSATRQYHRMACAIEDAGFEIRDMLSWLYGSGFPKSRNVSKDIDKKFGAEREKVRIPATGRIGSVNTVGGDIKGDSRPWIEAAKERGYHELDGDTPVTDLAREWDGWGTALKPALEPICFGRKPLIGTIVDNVLAHGTGAININACRVGDDEMKVTQSNGERISGNVAMAGHNTGRIDAGTKTGRWPANVLHDGSAEVFELFPIDDVSEESTARFFYTAKADGDDRLGSKHPTVKPVDLMQYLVRLVTPPGGTVLDCFAGTGTTGEAAFREGMRAVLIERESEYQNDIRRRMALVLGGRDERKHASLKAAGKVEDAGPLFANL